MIARSPLWNDVHVGGEPGCAVVDGCESANKHVLDTVTVTRCNECEPVKCWSVGSPMAA